MPTWTSQELVRLLEEDGWFEVAQAGSHRQFRHATKRGRVTVPNNKRGIPVGTVRSIYRQAGLDWSERKK